MINNYKRNIQYTNKMEIFNNKDIIESHILKNIKLNHLFKIRIINKIFKLASNKKFLLSIQLKYFKNFFKKYKISKILQSIKDKLYLANMFGDEDYAIMHTDNLEVFNKSIGWGINSIGDECWRDCFSFNYIIWTYEEKEFIYKIYGLALC